MKKVFLMLTIVMLSSFYKGIAQQDVDPSAENLLNDYYQLKDALVGGNSVAATKNALAFIKSLNALSGTAVNDKLRSSLSKDAKYIAQAKVISAQREKFISLSESLIEFAKQAKLSTAPVYHQYCPMKKAGWLSNSSAIKNPYYGSAMLSCGTVKSTL